MTETDRTIVSLILTGIGLGCGAIATLALLAIFAIPIVCLIVGIARM